MRKQIIALFLLGMMGIVVLGACSSGGGATVTQSTSTPEASSAAQVGDTVVADAMVVPVRWVALSFEVGGPLTAVNIKEGDAVKAGDVLAQLDDTDARLGVAQAEASLGLAQAQLAQTKASPRPAEIAAAEQSVKEAEAAVAAAQAGLAQLKTSVRAADVAAAQAGLAQAAYNLKVNQDRVAFAERGSERKDAQDALALAEQDYNAAQKRLNQVWAGPRQSELDAAQAGITAAQAQQAQAQSQLDLLKAGARQEQIAVAEAGVRQSEVALDIAKAALDDLSLVAPFDGEVSSLDARLGEVVAPGTPVVWLADLSAWQIETDDLTELSVVRVKVGDPVLIRFDALPDLELKGQVARIKEFGEDKRGDMTYTVLIELDAQDAVRSAGQLKWNMTASVTIGE